MQVALQHMGLQSDGTERYLVAVNRHSSRVKLTPLFHTPGAAYWPTIADRLPGIVVELADSPTFIAALSSAIRQATFIMDTQYADRCPA
jgi:hypothetical protein